MCIGNNSVCVIKLNLIFCYSLKNIIPLILSGIIPNEICRNDTYKVLNGIWQNKPIIPNEICRNDTYKVLNGIWQNKPWALRSKYSLYGCEECSVSVLLCASQKRGEKYFWAVNLLSLYCFMVWGNNFTFIFLLLFSSATPCSVFFSPSFLN